MASAHASSQLVVSAAAPAAALQLALANANHGPPRTSSSLPAPIMLLTGHEREVSSLAFDASGDLLASSSYDRDIFLWRVGAECENLAVLKGHKNAALCVTWSRDSRHLYSCSADKSVIAWDVETGQLVHRFKGHRMCITNVVVPNAAAGAADDCNFIVSAGDCGEVKLWDPRTRTAAAGLAQGIGSSLLPVTALQASSDMVYAASIDNVARAYDIRWCAAGNRGSNSAKASAAQFTCVGHTGTIVGMRLSPDNSVLLTNSVDNSVRAFDARAHAAAAPRADGKPSSQTQRTAHRIFEGAPHDFSSNMVRPAWSARGNYVACGSADRTVVVWEYASGRVMYKLPGHRGGVTDVAWHPRAAVLASSSVDKCIYVGELSRDVINE